MKNPLGILVLGLFVCNFAYALPKCKGSYSKQWTKCIGEWTFATGIFKGEVLNGFANGQETLIYNSGLVMQGTFKKNIPIKVKVNFDNINFKIKKVGPPIKIPVYVHIADISMPGWKKTTTKESVQEDFRQANQIWSQAKISWFVKKIKLIKVDEKLLAKQIKWTEKECDLNSKKLYLTSKSPSCLTVQNFRIKLNKNNRKLLKISSTNALDGINVYYLPRMRIPRGLCGVFPIVSTDMRKIKLGFVLMSLSCSKLPLSLAHELGHALGHAGHSSDKNNLMVQYGHTIEISDQQAKDYRNYYKKYLQKLFE